ncbi:hypothetical protein ES332_A04G067500v1 [Gossypium tomentosum]|uniref:Uncharacterized protein n=1 Tax=Gossypium tomentosum TaxID=34277 RepID=A0A5D2QYF1_GOSTO|nr:hypothetical protein ES332_A04G067500v1 [Gossypium tomentosum]
MPRSSRGSKVPQRQSPRGSSSDSYPLRHRAIIDSSSPKLRECRSRSGTPQSGPLNQKKLGTRIADSETQLGHAQQGLKILKHQLDSAEAAKKEAQEQLEKKTKKPKALQKTHDSKKTHSCSLRDEFPEDNRRETDVFEVPMEKVGMEPKLEVDTTDAIETSIDPTTALEPEKPPLNDLALKDDEINVLKSKLAEKENEVIAYAQENEDLKNQLNEVTTNISIAKAKKAEMSLSLYWELSIFMENQIYGYQIIESQRYGYQILESQRYGYQILESQIYGYRDIGIIKSEIFAIYGP